MSDNMDIIHDEEMIEKCDAMNIDEDFKLFKAIECNDYKEVEKLIKEGANIESRGIDNMTAIHYALSLSLFYIVKYLIKYGANLDVVDCQGNTLLHTYLELSEVDGEIFNILCQKSKNINQQNDRKETPLHIDCYNFGDNITDLLKFGADPNIKNNLGENALFCLLDGEDPLTEKIDLLLTKITNINEKDNDSNTILHFICSIYNEDFAEIAEYLAKKCNVNAVNSLGQTPIFILSENIFDGIENELMDILIKNGAKTNEQDYEGDTILHYIVQDSEEVEDFDIARFVKKYKLDVFKKNRYGYTPLDITIKRGFKETAMSLRKLMKK